MTGTLTGRIKKTGLEEGDYEISLQAITSAKWSKKEAEGGEKVKLQAEAAGFEDGVEGIFQVWEKDINRADTVVATIDKVALKGGKLEAEWAYEYRSQPGEEDVTDRPAMYSSPRYFFTVKLENCQARSGLLRYKDCVEIELRDEKDEPVAEAEYKMYLRDGSVRSGKLDKNGKAKEEKVPPGRSHVAFSDNSKVVNKDI